jgi:hypothetical protein
MIRKTAVSACWAGLALLMITSGCSSRSDEAIDRTEQALCDENGLCIPDPSTCGPCSLAGTRFCWRTNARGQTSQFQGSCDPLPMGKACTYVGISSDGTGGTNQGAIGTKFGGGSISSVYPGTAECPNALVVELENPAPILYRANTYLHDFIPVVDKATCEGTTLAMAMWGQTPDGAWHELLRTTEVFGFESSIDPTPSDPGVCFSQFIPSFPTFEVNARGFQKLRLAAGAVTAIGGGAYQQRLGVSISPRQPVPVPCRRREDSCLCQYTGQDCTIYPCCEGQGVCLPSGTCGTP